MLLANFRWCNIVSTAFYRNLIKSKVVISLGLSALLLAAGLWAGIAHASVNDVVDVVDKPVTQTSTSSWPEIESRGANQDVYFHAWGGDPQINRYIQWAAKQVKQQ